MAAEQGLSRSTVLGLVAMALAVLVIGNDFTALSVALPNMEKDLNTNLAHAQWVINGYALVFGVLIVTGGRMADMFGRRRIFFVGAAIFATFSLLGGLAPNVWVVLICRAIMGIGGAMMWPAILGMTYSLVPDGKAGLAGGLIIGVAGFSNALGPLLGGVLTDTLSWRWIFYLNVPVTAFAIFVTWRVVAADEATQAERHIDFGGVVTLSTGLFALLIALTIGTDAGWTDPIVLGLVVVTIVFLVLFRFVEARIGSRALVPSDVMQNRTFRASALATLSMSAIFFGALLYLPQYTSKILGFSAIQSGAGLLPMMGMFALTSFIAGPLYDRLGAKLIVSTGAACLAAGMFILSRIHPGTTYVELIPGMVVLGIGIGLFYSSVTTAGITAIGKDKASLAGAIIYMAQIAGGSIGLGLNTAIVLSASHLATGISWAFLFNTFLAICGLVIVLTYIHGKTTKPERHAMVHRHRAHG